MFSLREEVAQCHVVQRWHSKDLSSALLAAFIFLPFEASAASETG